MAIDGAHPSPSPLPAREPPHRQKNALAIAVSPEQPLRVRQEAADALATIGDESQVARLGAALESALGDQTFQGEQLRIGFVRALGGIHSPAARDVLLRHADRELSRNERAFVETALARR